MLSQVFCVNNVKLTNSSNRGQHCIQKERMMLIVLECARANQEACA